MRALAILIAALAGVALADTRTPTARELGERYQRTRTDADRAAWIQALDREGYDFSKPLPRAPIGPRGIYKFNRESKLVYVMLRKTDLPGESWDEEVEDGTIHFEWTRKPNGGIDYRYTCPTNWDVFVRAYPGTVTRYAAKIAKKNWRKGDPMPAVTLPEGWRLVKGEEHTGVNVREAFLTFECDGTNRPAPQVAVDWRDVAIESVHGARDVKVSGAAATFVPTAKKPPMGFMTGLPQVGAVSAGLMHHVEGMQAGPYRAYPYPVNEARAVDNFVFALREGFRRIGFDRKEAMDGSIWLGGFDSHYPNGHTDFPPHFHVIANARDGQQVSHFYVDRTDGRIIDDHMQDMSRVMDVWDRVFVHARGAEWPMYDNKGLVAFRLKILEDGTGLQVWTADRAKTFRVAGTRPCDALDVLVPDGAGWKSVLTVSVRDNPEKGIWETPDGIIRYDRVTGARLQQ